MSRYLLPFLITFVLCACDSSVKNFQNSQNHTTTPVRVNYQVEREIDLEKHLQAYEALKKRIKKKKQYFFTDVGHSAEMHRKLAKQYFFHTLVDSIFPYWYGTKWDFNGHTETPRVGEIACGYFVSTTLRDMGLPINRYKVAQKAALDILKDFSPSNKIRKFDNFGKMCRYLSTLPENQLLLLGLDYHVGFVVKQGQELYFIHAGYTGRAEVEKESLTQSASAQNSALFYLGSLTETDHFITRWRGRHSSL